MSGSCSPWLESLLSQAEFYCHANKRARTDPTFPWKLVDTDGTSARDLAKRALRLIGARRTPRQSCDWVTSNAEALWETRCLLNDELSRHLFDATLVLRLSGHQRYYFPRTEFDDLVELVDEHSFEHDDLPHHYLGMPLKILDVRLKGVADASPVSMVACKQTLILLNRYRQYFVRRSSFDSVPCSGDVVLDCGACIGDITALFAGLVGVQGQVHAFDPVPLHVRFCQLQASLNPSLAHMIHVNELAVSNSSRVVHGTTKQVDEISPGGLAVDSFACTSLDEYAGKRLDRVDYIKMDIEGAEPEAIDGAARVIREFSPRLAISAYHQPHHLWQIPLKLKEINPGYDLYFGHHSPVFWESVFYAVQRPG